jgi:Ca-activated chloride channel family protein
VSFGWPLVLVSLIAIPVVIRLYGAEQRRRARAAEAFATKPMMPSVASERPGWRRHAPMLAFAVALTALIFAAARPQQSVAVPLTDGAVMLVNDVSASMASTDVSPSRLGAAQRAARSFVAAVPAAVRVGLISFNDHPTVLQSPSGDHALTGAALGQLRVGGHTAIGDAVNAAVRILSGLKAQNGRRPPGAIVLISDGTSTTGADPLAAARAAAAQHIPVYTVAVGTTHGTIPGSHGPNPVPLDASELTKIAQLSNAQTFTANDARRLNTVYAHLAAQIGHKHVKHEITAGFAGAGLVLLLVGSGLSLHWFGRLV